MKIDRLREIREDRDLKQEDVAKMLGTTQQQYSKYELGMRLIPVEKLCILADYYNTSIDYLVGRTNNPKFEKKWYEMYYTDRIKWVRDCKNITQKEVADYIGVKQQQYARYEKGINVMPVTYLHDICICLNVSSDFIIGLTDEMIPLFKDN